MPDHPPARSAFLSRLLLGVCFVIAGVGLAAIIRPIAVDYEQSVAERGEELFSDKRYRDGAAALTDRDPVAEAQAAMAENDFTLLVLETPGGPVVEGVRCHGDARSKPVPGFEDAVEPATMQSVDQQNFHRALRRFAAAYNQTIARHPVFASLWECVIA